MKNLSNLIGKRFYRLLVLSRAANRNGNIYWNVRCDCGTEKAVSGSNLRTCLVSCGCFDKERRVIHGYARHPLYMTWANMIRRCGNSDYGRRYSRVRVCSQWKRVEAFIEYVERVLGPRPTKSHTIDRIRNSRHYVPGNIRWATKGEQSNNRDCVNLFEYQGERGTIRFFSDKYGVNFATIKTRLRKGLTICQALETPLSKQHVLANKIKHSGKVQKVVE